MNNNSLNTESFPPSAGGVSEKKIAEFKTLELKNSDQGKFVKSPNTKLPLFGQSYLLDLGVYEPRSGKTTLKR